MFVFFCPTEVQLVLSVAALVCREFSQCHSWNPSRCSLGAATKVVLRHRQKSEDRCVTRLTYTTTNCPGGCILEVCFCTPTLVIRVVDTCSKFVRIVDTRCSDYALLHLVILWRAPTGTDKGLPLEPTLKAFGHMFCNFWL